MSRASAETQETVAEALFQDAKQLIRQGKYADACPMLAESHRVDPAGGTVLLLAMCYEKLGKTASAWVKFNEALSMARRDGRPDREQRAHEYLEVLEPQLCRVRLEPSSEARRIPGLRVALDGTEVRLESLTALPVDPGEHEVTAWAPGRRRFAQHFAVKAAEARTIVVPALADAPHPAPAASSSPTVTRGPGTASPAADRSPSLTSTAGWVIGASGVVSLGVAGFFGWRAKNKHDDALALCPEPQCSDMTGVQLNEDAQWAATRANAFGVLGGLAVGVGAVLLLTSDDGGSARSALVVSPTPGGAKLGATSSF